ncbi:dTDP-4-dehydrorhamnose 3,5-epimerase family protein [Gammaproteobacteria bacterium]|nr:dTDP-4-dehydrorhamnose 3,5-epimerase family protein [Gammaproteobacteria bacterium]
MSNQSLFPKLNELASTFSDSRGSMDVLYESCSAVLKRSNSKKGVFRGLHKQTAPAEQVKIIRIISGKIIDFVTDPKDNDEIIWYTELSSGDGWVIIESNLAHGFYALEDVVFEYFCDGAYNESLEQVFRIDIIIEEALGLQPFYLSDKDLKGIPYGKSVRPFIKTKQE